MRFHLALLLVLVPSQLLAGDAAADRKAAIAYVQKLQTITGGFLSTVAQQDAAPTLRATSAAVRALHYLGGDIPDKAACVKFVESCYDPASGGFSDTPRGKPDVFTTAVGLMAVTELKMPTDKIGPAAVKYLSENAKGFEEIRIAAAGLERLNATSPRGDAWKLEVTRTGNADGVFGKGRGQARDTASAIVTFLRLGARLDDPAPTLKLLQAGQRPDGGFGKEDSDTSDLETSYRVLRCFVMLKARPQDVKGLREFVAKCRNADGGSGVAPGQPSNVNGTYFAAIITHWLDRKE
jgi:prenyltransferase beta subunit